MNPEARPTQIVFNPRSGDFRTPQQTAEALAEEWPFGIATVLPFAQVLAEPDLLQDSNVIGLGGDGTHGTLARLNYALNDESWYLALHAGTAGFIPRSLGLRSKRGESTRDYTNRIIQDIDAGQLTVISVPPGTITQTADDSDPQDNLFLSSASFGQPSSRTRMQVEERRSHTTRFKRMATSIYTYRNLIHSAPPLTVRTGDHTFQAADAGVLKHPFKQSKRIELPFPGQDILFAVSTRENRSHIDSRICIDLVRMLILHKVPSAGGITIEPVLPDESVDFSYLTDPRHANPRLLSIDFELQPGAETAVQIRCSDTRNNKQIHIVARQGTIFDRTHTHRG